MTERRIGDTMITPEQLSHLKKKTGEELQMYFHFKKRGGAPAPKKGKGSYNRKKVDKKEWY